MRTDSGFIYFLVFEPRLQASSQQYRETHVSPYCTVPYEFPNGTRLHRGEEEGGKLSIVGLWGGIIYICMLCMYIQFKFIPLFSFFQTNKKKYRHFKHTYSLRLRFKVFFMQEGHSTERHVKPVWLSCPACHSGDFRSLGGPTLRLPRLRL